MRDVDLLIRGGTVIDGSGASGRLADVALVGDRITEVGSMSGLHARNVIDACGHVVCPGFIDMHSHSDVQALAAPDNTAKVAQGITLEVLGQDGLSYAPTDDRVLKQMRYQLRGWNGDPVGFNWNWRTVGEYLDRLDGSTMANTAYLIPHGTVRCMIVGNENRPATRSELSSMAHLVVKGMEDGAAGMSAGLTYAPGMYASDDEIVQLCRIVAQYGGYYSPHHRNYGADALTAYRDCIEIGRQSGVAVHLTHAHLGYPQHRNRADELLAIVDAAIDEGVDVTLDSYPYLAGCSYLHGLLPGWAQEGGAEAIMARIESAAGRTMIRRDIAPADSAPHEQSATDWNLVVISGVSRTSNEAYVGKSIQEIAQGGDAVDAFCQLLVDDDLGTTFIHHIGNEENVRAIMLHPAHMGSTDGILVGGLPHPRGWGSFPRYLAVYVRELGLLQLEEAIRKFTSLPARRLGLTDRGRVQSGMFADLVVFDPQRVRDRSTYANPRRSPIGVPHVIVNGTPVIQNGKGTGARPGRALRLSL